MEIERQEDMCVKCNKRTATVDFAADTTAAIHGWTIRICELCYIKEQLAFASKQAARIPQLESKLTKLLEKEK